MKALVGSLLGFGLSIAALAASLPYDDAADPHVALRSAMLAARSQHKDVLLIFGANWCEDCRDLDKAMHGSSASLIDPLFVVVKINVGNFDRNLDLAARYGNPIRKGIPAAVLLTPADQMVYSTKAGELADARRMGDSGIYDFFSKVLVAHRPH
ncbi:MAG: thioredoxin family protein [Steroidobacteraceae bacterium]